MPELGDFYDTFSMKVNTDGSFDLHIARVSTKEMDWDHRTSVSAAEAIIEASNYVNSRLDMIRLMEKAKKEAPPLVDLGELT